MKAFAGKHFLLIVENNPVPFDRRVWREAGALRDAGARISVIAPQDGDQNRRRETLEGIGIFRYRNAFSTGSKAGYLREYFTALIKTFWLFHIVGLSRGRIDAVHVANPPDIFWPLALYLKLLRVRFIFDEHDLSPETYLSRFDKPSGTAGPFYRVLRVFEYLSYKFADAVISTNETYKRVAGQRCPATARKTFVVRNGPDIRWFKPTKPNSALKKGRSYLLGYLGIMAVQDGVEYILKAARYLIREKRFDDFIIYLIGAGDDVRRLKRLAKDYALEREVVFTGRLPDGPTIEILSTADLCLSPDPFNALNDSSTMNKVMEYMALGKPIVSFQLSEARYSAGDAALYVTNNDERAFAEGIYELLLDGGRRDQMGRYGKRRLEDKLAWHKQIDNLIEVYRFVGGTPPDRRQKPDGPAPRTPRRTR